MGWPQFSRLQKMRHSFHSCVDVDEWVEMQKQYRESKELLFELKSQLLGLRGPVGEQKQETLESGGAHF